MLQVLTYIQNEPSWLKSFYPPLPEGHPAHPNNTAPAAWREITEAEMAQSRWTDRRWDATEYRQITHLRDGSCVKGDLSVHLYYYNDGSGYAVHFDYWAKRVCWFAFGCDHTYQEISHKEANRLGITTWATFCHVQRCTKCGYAYAVDTSG